MMMRAAGRMAVGLIWAIVAVAVAFAEESTQSVVFKILPQPLDSALVQFSEQSSVQLVVTADTVRDKATKGVQGSFEPAKALSLLLEGSGLEYSQVNARSFAIRPAVPRDTASDEANRDSGSMMRLAQAQGSAASAAAAAENQAGNEDGQALEELTEIVVTGTHIRGAKDETAPLLVLDRAYIESTGLSTTSRLIESLPQNFSLASQSGVNVPGVSLPGAQGSSINLRGIGEGTTLVLLNGQRMALGFLGGAVDISALPLSAIDRVEVLTDGASAVYGSDAVGGVVNFILRQDFDGAETALRSGWADGVNEYRASQVVGNSWQSGNALLSAEYYTRDLLRANERDFVPSTSRVGSLFPKDESYSVMAAANQALAESLKFSAHALYSKRHGYNEGGAISIAQKYRVENPQITASAGLNWRLQDEWELETSLGYAQDKMDFVDTASLARVAAQFKMRTATAKMDGPLLTLPGGKLRAAFGIDWRSETYSDAITFDLPIEAPSHDEKQTVRSAFAELRIPLIGDGNAATAARRLELSIAGRFDDYSSFGSSFDPRFGVLWEPIHGIRLRGSYGTSYVAPRLVDLSTNSNSALAFTDFDPAAPSGFSRQLWLIGTGLDTLTAQESESSSFGIEFIPAAVTGLQVALNYYKINYSNRIADPLTFPVLANPESFASIIFRNPPAELINEFIALGELGSQGFGDCDFDPNFCTPDPNFDPASIEVALDLRRRNLSELKTSGFDVSLDYDFNVAGADMQLALAGTHIFEIEQQITSASPPFNTEDTFNNPPDWRLRGSAAWQRGSWSANLFVNYTDSYTDNRSIPVASISSNTTVDTRIAYDFKDMASNGFLSGVTLSVSALNLFDRDPPRTAVLFDVQDMGFDPTNASPMGRLIAVEASKVW